MRRALFFLTLCSCGAPTAEPPRGPVDVPDAQIVEAFSRAQTTLNPTRWAPLSAWVDVSFPIEGTVAMTITSRDEEVPPVEHTFPGPAYNHRLEVHGLYSDHLNEVVLTFTDTSGRLRATHRLKIQTPDVGPFIDTKIESISLDPALREPGMYLMGYVGGGDFDTHRPYMIDGRGRIRWILAFTQHPELVKLIAGNGFHRMRNGNFVVGGRENQTIYEISMMGDIVRTWNLEPLGIGFHHEVIEMPSGNLLFNATRFGESKPDGSPAVMDHVIELNRETGAVVTDWDLKRSLDPTRDLLRVDQGPANWMHGNGIRYLPNEDAIILSTRFQGFVKLTRDNRVCWILSPHRGWTVNGRGEHLGNFLLTPLDAAGKAIEDPAVADGGAAGADFEWNWSSHAPRPLSDGRLLVYDNGYMRHFDKGAPSQNYSRAVIYRIDEERRTVQQLWQYGRERGAECYSFAGGSVQMLPRTGNVMFAGGVSVSTSSGSGGRLIEVDPRTDRVVCEIEFTPPHNWPFQSVSQLTLYP